MGLRSLIVAVSLVAVSALALQGCSKDAQKVQPETRGKRGETCLARNDCDTGLACLNGICAKNEFNISVTAKQCVREECSEDKDCCGDLATAAPAKCQGREEICNQPTLPNCQPTTCLDDTTCGGGGSCLGTCQGQTTGFGMPCADPTDCTPTANICSSVTPGIVGTCSATFQPCSPEAPCAKSVATCLNKSCKCQNPAYMPAADICTDPECEDICLLRCQDKLCLQDQSCKTDVECLAKGSKICDGGRCVECTQNSECDKNNDETCVSGVCHKPCKVNEECPLFEACEKGDCVYVGCNDDRDCILAASRGLQGVGGTNGNPQAAGADDPRLYQCLANEADPKHKTCKIPCENDGSCGQFQVCDGGYCKFVGCDTDEQCRNYLGIANQMTTDSKPYVAQAKCLDPVAAAAAAAK